MEKFNSFEDLNRALRNDPASYGGATFNTLKEGEKHDAEVIGYAKVNYDRATGKKKIPVYLVKANGKEYSVLIADNKDVLTVGSKIAIEGQKSTFNDRIYTTLVNVISGNRAGVMKYETEVSVNTPSLVGSLNA